MILTLATMRQAFAAAGYNCPQPDALILDDQQSPPVTLGGIDQTESIKDALTYLLAVVGQLRPEELTWCVHKKYASAVRVLEDFRERLDVE